MLIFAVGFAACEEGRESMERPQTASASDSFDVVISAIPSGSRLGNGDVFGDTSEAIKGNKNNDEIAGIKSEDIESGGKEKNVNDENENLDVPNTEIEYEDKGDVNARENESSKKYIVKVKCKTRPTGANIVLQSEDRDSTWEGESPHTFTVPAGEYQWAVQKSGYREETSKVRLQESKTLSPNLSREQYVLEVSTTPDSSTVKVQNVYTDEQFESQAPPHVFEVPFGRYNWTVQKPGYEQATSDTPLTVRGREKTRVELSRERHVLEVNTTPAPATATLRNLKTGETWMEETPHKFRLPPGQYEWTVQKEGFATQKSEGSIDLLTRSERTESIELTPTELPVTELVDRGDKSLENQEYQEAISYYEQVPVPGSGQDDTNYLQAQSRLARAYVQLENWEKAINTYQNILDRSPTQYEARLNMARIFFEIESYEEAEKQLNRVNQLKQHIPKEKRQEVSLRIEYRKALIPYQQFRSAQTSVQKRNFALKALSPLRSFMERVPSELESDFDDELEDARQKLEDVRSFLE